LQDFEQLPKESKAKQRKDRNERLKKRVLGAKKGRVMKPSE